MLIYRIQAARFTGDNLIASGRAARWNPNDVKMIYTASSRSLACLENAVHRSQTGLSLLFNILTIECPNQLKIQAVTLNDLPTDWKDFNEMHLTQRIGERWIKNGGAAILQVPSSIIEEEVNYLLNPEHPDFKQIKLIKTQPFVFDTRIKQ